MSSKRNIRCGSIIAMAIILVLMISACGSGNTGSSDKTIDLMQYVTVTFSGDNGYGKASYAFDYGSFENMLAEKLNTDKNSAQFFADAVIIEEGIKTSLDKTTGLSNGDKITLTVSYNEAAAKDYKLTFQGGTSSFTAEKLTEITEFSVDDSDAIALLSETTVFQYMQEIPVLPDRISYFEITDSQVDYQRNTAQVDYTYDMDCEIAVLSVTGSIQYKYENDAWTDNHISRVAEIKEYTLSGVYTGTEWGITGDGASCNARYEITEKDGGSYEVFITWSANAESSDMAEHTVTISLTNYFETSRFLISNINSEIKTADGKSPYLYRALKFDFISGGFTTGGEVELQKVAD